mgnify:CR=1 FL=1
MSSVFSKILVGLDGSDSSLRAVDSAVSVAEKYNSDMILLTIIGTSLKQTTSTFITAPTYSTEELDNEKIANEKIHEMIKLKYKQINSINSVIVERSASIERTIVEYANSEKVDLIIVGSKGRTGIKKILLGSVASAVVAHAHCPVLVIK